MPIVQVSLLAGRTAEQKKAMAVEITDTINKHSGAPKEVITVMFSDIERDLKAKCEHSTNEIEGDKWSKHHDNIQSLIKDLLNG